MKTYHSILKLLAAAFLLFVTVHQARAASQGTASDIVELPPMEVFGQRPSAVMTPGLLQRLGGVEGARDWVGIMVSDLYLDFSLRQKLLRFASPEERIALNQLIVNTMLGKPLGVEKRLIDTVADLDLTAGEFNAITESVLDTCEETNLSYRDCNRVLVSIRSLGLYAREF